MYCSPAAAADSTTSSYIFIEPFLELLQFGMGSIKVKYQELLELGA